MNKPFDVGIFVCAEFVCICEPYYLLVKRASSGRICVVVVVVIVVGNLKRAQWQHTTYLITARRVSVCCVKLAHLNCVYTFGRQKRERISQTIFVFSLAEVFSLQVDFRVALIVPYQLHLAPLQM